MTALGDLNIPTQAKTGLEWAAKNTYIQFLVKLITANADNKSHTLLHVAAVAANTPNASQGSICNTVLTSCSTYHDLASVPSVSGLAIQLIANY